MANGQRVEMTSAEKNALVITQASETAGAAGAAAFTVTGSP